MRNRAKLQRAAMAAAVAAALMAGAGPAGAVSRLPDEIWPSRWFRLPDGRAKLVNGGGGFAAKLNEMLSSVRRTPDEGGGVQLRRLPDGRQSRSR